MAEQREGTTLPENLIHGLVAPYAASERGITTFVKNAEDGQ